MAERSLELTIISAKGLNNVNLLGKMDVYAVVYIDCVRKQDQMQKTDVDKDGNSNPTWNYPMKFTIDESAALQNRWNLVVKIKTVGLFSDKDLGDVHVPVKELLEGGSTGSKPLQFVTYQVRKPDGKPKGELTFSYKFGGKSAGVGAVEEPVTAYPAGNPNMLYELVMPNLARKADKVDEPVITYPPIYSAPAVYPPLAVGAAPCFYPPVGGEIYPPPTGYPGYYSNQQQPAYDGYRYPPPPLFGYGGYPPQPEYGC